MALRTSRLMKFLGGNALLRASRFPGPRLTRESAARSVSTPRHLDLEKGITLRLKDSGAGPHLAAPWTRRLAWLVGLTLAFGGGSSLLAEEKREFTLTVTKVLGAENRPLSVTTKLDVTAYEKDGKGGRDKGGHVAFYFVEPQTDKSAIRLPLGKLEVNGKGRVQMRIAHPMDAVLTGALRRVYGVSEAVPTSRITGLEAGDERIKISGLRTNARVPVTFEAEIDPANPDRVIYRTEMVGDSVKSSFLQSSMEITKIEHELVFDKETNRLVRAQWVQLAKRHGGGGNTTLMNETIVFEETNHEKLERSEFTVAEREFAKLEPIAVGAMPGQTVKKLEKLIGDLESFASANSDSAFVKVVPALTAALDRQLTAAGRPR
ncbi:MAG: hypothetical protein AAF488_18365, partial [Planctomycetota bacterium]